MNNLSIFWKLKFVGWIEKLGLKKNFSYNAFSKFWHSFRISYSIKAVSVLGFKNHQLSKNTVF